ncbi:4'-phosphopantetheinyl transferase superfamily protein [Synechococcus sp. MIT S9504]|uniref:4'-phosphopantetheinyl transferase family protein n=1 Tax=Synechococcus sp. MIT S9504 TaxID=1801628 RepID=UPI00082CE06E|nr:4'-phosphopantetheinyl transferase superfamily protein [Synechococcus sp. MIT S9504]
MDSRTVGGSVTALWMQQIGPEASAGELVVSEQERAWAAGLTASRRQQYLASRGWMRSCLAALHAADPLQVPLDAPPGAPPRLLDAWGYVSLSHCADACLMGWSQQPIGVDLERADRKLRAAAALMRRFFTETEQCELTALEGDQLRQQVLDRWLVKEAAIKWQRGSLAQDLCCWEVSSSFCGALHRGLNLKVAAQLRSQGDWRFGVVVAEQTFLQDCLLCSA